MPLAPGTEVIDSLFGAARVVHETKRGYLLVLNGLDSLKVDRPREELSMPDGRPVADLQRHVQLAPREQKQPEAPSPDRALSARRAIDALRFGVVPASHVADLTEGYDNLVDWVTGQLAGPGEAPRAASVFGPFGSGKSHTMAVVREIARQQGFLTMATEVNGSEISLAQPKELLASLLGHLSESPDLDGATPLLALVLHAVEGGSRHPAGRRADALATDVASINALARTHGFDDLGDLIERLIGSDPSLTQTDFRGLVQSSLMWRDQALVASDPRYSPRTLVRWSPVEFRPHDFAQALIGYAALARAAGHKGLVATVDELEVEDALYSATRMRKLNDFVNGMRDELGNNEPLEGGLTIFLAAVGEGSSIQDEVVNFIVEPTGGGSYNLRPWDDSDLIELARRIWDVYAAAHGPLPSHDPRVATRVLGQLGAQHLSESGRVRAFIRAFVSRLDIEHGPPAA